MSNIPNYYQIARVNTANNANQYNKNEEDSDLSDDDENKFTEDNEEFIEFKKNVKEWITLDDDILKLQRAIKERRNKKNELTPKIMDFMGRYEINDLNTNDGKLKYTKSLQTKPLNKDFIISRLGDYFKDFNKGEKAATFLLENRDKEEKFKLRRVMEKKGLKL